MPLDPVALAKGIQAFAGFTLAGYVAAAISGVVRGEVRQARLRVAEGVVTALGLMLPATILRTLAVRDWDQIQSLAFVLAMRVVVKHFFAWEKPRLGGSRA